MPSRAKNVNGSVGSRLKQLRLSKNITQRELAEYLNKSESAVRMWELEKSEPDLETLKYIADFFDVTIDHLLDRKIEEFDKSTIELLDVWNSMPEETRKEALTYLRCLKRIKQEENN